MRKAFLSFLFLSFIFHCRGFGQEDELAMASCGRTQMPSYYCSYNCYAENCTDCNTVLNIWCDYLFWSWRTDGFPYAVASTLRTKQDVKRITPKFRSAFRIGFEYKFPYFGCWDLSAEWTSLISSIKDSASISGYIDMHGVWLSSFINPTITSADAEYHVKLNLLDLNMGRTFCPTRTLSIQPFFGFRAAWINQDFNVFYIFQDSQAGQYYSANSIDYQGYGARFGFDTKWELLCGFSMIANTCLDILWAKTHIKQRNYAFSDFRDKIYVLTPIFEIFGGFMWEYCFNCFCIRSISAHVGWEQQYFINLAQFNAYGSSTAQAYFAHQIGGLGVGGLVAGFDVGF